MGKVPGMNGDENSQDPDGGQSSPTIVLVLCVSGSRDLAGDEGGVTQLWRAEYEAVGLRRGTDCHTLCHLL